MRRCYVHLSRFPVQRRVMETPSLAGKALALVENARGHWRVAFASTAALKAGVRPGMTKTAACALVPELPCFDYDPDAERAALVSLGEALLQCGPQFQLSPPDGMWLDASAAHLFGGEAGLGQRIAEVCKAHGYRANVAIASEAFTSRALARFGAGRFERAAPEESAHALRTLPLTALEGGAEALQAPLRSLGLSTLGEVAALPSGAVVARLGADGLRAHRLCRGEDDSPLVAEPLAEVLAEKVDLDWPAEAMEPLLFALKTLLDRVCARLAGRSQAAVKLDFALRLDPSGTETVPLTLARPSAQPRLLLDLLRHRISDLTLPNPVAGLILTVVEACEDRGQQLPLGDAPEGDAALEVVLSRLATALGEEALFAAEIGDAHRPEGAYAPTAFRPPERERGLAAEVARAVSPRGGVGALPSAPPGMEDTLLARPSRFFEKATSLDADVGGAGELRSARLLGRRRRVEAVSGPERLRGEWWEAAYARDYYRVHFEGLGPVWVYRDEKDGRFYLHGMFD